MASGVAERLGTIRRRGALRNADVARVLNARPETVSRWQTGRSYPQATTEAKILQLEHVLQRLGEIYTPAEARLWLFSPQKLLGGATPAELIRDGREAEVRRLLDQVTDAVYF